MRRLIVILLIILLGMAVTVKNSRNIKASDPYLRDRIVKLVNAEGSSCSGVEVKIKGVVYTLTAGHCRELLDSAGQMTAIDEQKHEYPVKFVREDMHSDLLLLTGIGKKSVEIADSAYSHEKVKAITHGHGWDAFRTDGELVQEELVMVPESIIHSQGELDQCKARQPKVVPMFDVTSGTTYCVLSVNETISTTYILPGSSGGPLFDMEGKIVGITSAATSEDIFGRFVRLSDIQAFAKSI